MLALTSWENLHLRFLPKRHVGRKHTEFRERERVGAGNFCFLSKISELITPIPSDGVEIYGARRTQTSSSMRSRKHKKQEVRCLCLGFL